MDSDEGEAYTPSDRTNQVGVSNIQQGYELAWDLGAQTIPAADRVDRVPNFP